MPYLFEWCLHQRRIIGISPKPASSKIVEKLGEKIQRTFKEFIETELEAIAEEEIR